MPNMLCFDRKTFLLYFIVGLSIIGFSLWKTYNTSQQPINVTVNTPPAVIAEGYLAEGYPAESPNVPPYRQADLLFRGPDPQFVDMRVPTNIHGYSDGLFSRMGILYHDTNQEYRLPLFGRRDYPMSRDYRYYVMDHTIHQNKIELDPKDFLNDGDKTKVPGYPGRFTVHLYAVDFPSFHPNVIGSRGGPLPFKTVYG